MCYNIIFPLKKGLDEKNANFNIHTLSTLATIPRIFCSASDLNINGQDCQTRLINSAGKILNYVYIQIILK